MYAQRNSDGKLIGVYSNEQDYATEEISVDDVEVVDFLKQKVPSSVTPYQAIQALNSAGKLTQVESAIAVSDKMTQYAWSRATSFDRDSAIVAALTQAFGWSDTDLDNLFISAASFE